MGYFDKGLFDFLSELKTHNDRAWFNKNKDRFEQDIKEPFLDFISDAGPQLRFDPDHPMIEDIKRKSFTTGVKITNKQVLADGFMKTFIGACREMAPLMKFLATAAGVPW